MASKKRGGLSKRESAAQQAGGVLNYKTGRVSVPNPKPKPSSKPSTVGTPEGAIGQNADGGYIMSDGSIKYPMSSETNPQALNYHPRVGYSFQAPSTRGSSSGGGRKTASSANTQRNTAANYLNQTIGIPTAEASDGSDYSTAKLTPTTKKTGLGRFLQILADPLGARPKIKNAFGIDIPRRPDLGITEALGMNDTGSPFALRENSGLANYTNDQGGVLSPSDQVTVGDYYGLPSDQRDTNPINDYVASKKNERNGIFNLINTARASDEGTQNNNSFADQNNVGPWASGYGREQDFAPKSSADIAQETAPETPAWEAPGYQSPTGSVSGYFGSGRAGNGALASNAYLSNLAPEEADYIKSLRNSLKGDFGAKSARKQFDELIKALDPTYDLQQKTATGELEKAKNEDINKLAALFAANNTAGSEQQTQYVQRTQGDYATQLADLLAKLAASKSSDIAQFKGQLQNTLSEIGKSKSTAQQRVADTIYQVQKSARDRALSSAKGSSNAQSQRAKALDALLKKASGLATGGREWAQSVAPSLGLSPQEVAQYTPDNWESMYGGGGQPNNIVSIGNGYLLNKDTGDVYQAY